MSTSRFARISESSLSAPCGLTNFAEQKVWAKANGEMVIDFLHLHLFSEWFFNLFYRKCFLVHHIQDQKSMGN